MVALMSHSKWMSAKLAELRGEKATALSTNSDLVWQLRWISKLSGQPISQIVDRMIRTQVEDEFAEYEVTVEKILKQQEGKDQGQER